MNTKLSLLFKHIYAFLFLAIILDLGYTTLPVQAASYQGQQSATHDFARIDAFIRQEMQTNRIPGVALGIVHGNQIAHLQGFGVAHTDGLPVTPQTPFILGSVTKSMTALAVMQLVEAGKINLDMPFRHYLPWFRVATAGASDRITVRHLLSHTSGLPEFVYGISYQPTLEQFAREYSKVALDRPVGASFEYSNLNYSLLGLLIESVSGQSYESWIQQHIFEPLQMQHSFTSTAEARQAGMAQGYQWRFGYPVASDVPHHHVLLPAGWLISNAEDMTHYLLAQMNEGRFGKASVLSSTDIALMHSPQPRAEVHIPDQQYGPGSSYGLGWFTGTTYGIPAYYHEGEALNYHAFMVIEPGIDWGAILLVNVDNPAINALTLDQLQGGVTRLLANTPPPQTSLTIPGFYLMIEILLAILSLLLLGSALRLPWWYKAFKRYQGSMLRRVLRLCIPILWELLLPGLILIAPSWLILLTYLPELAWWALMVCFLLILTGMVRIVFGLIIMARSLRQSLSRDRLHKLSPAAK